MRVARIGVVVAGGSALAIGLCVACVGDSPSTGAVVLDASTTDTGVGTMPVDSGGGGPMDAGTQPSTDSGMPCTAQIWPAPNALNAQIDTNSNELSATLTGDVLTMFFTRGGGGSVSVYQATRTATTDFGNVVVLTDIAPNYYNGGMVPSITGDGLTMYLGYRSFPDGGADLFPPEGGVDAGPAYFDIYRYTRQKTTDAFTGPEHVTELSSGFNNMQPSISGDGNTIVFASDRDTDGGVLRLYEATKNGTKFGTPTQITGLFSDSTIPTSYPALNADATELYFSAPPMPSFGGDIYVSKRGTAGSAFGAATSVPSLNSNFDDRPAWVSPDECRMYTVSKNKNGDYDILVSLKK
jgi:hypothetical protein